MSDFKELIAQDIRLVILRALEKDSDYSLNESVLQSILAEFGHNISRDRVKTELDWLEEQNLVTLRQVASVKVAKLTDRGLDVAMGRVKASGVKRPSPGE